MSRRRIFISFCYEDVKRASGFNLLRYTKCDFVGRHLLSPVDSQNKAYIARCIRDQIHNTSVTVVLIGRDTAASEWVDKEIKWSLEKDCPNGIVGIKLDPSVATPAALVDCGAEIIDWDSNEFDDAIDRAAICAGRPPVTSGSSAAQDANCSRA